MAVVLVALFILLLVIPRPRTHFAAVQFTAYNKVALPPVQYAAQDLATFERAFGESVHGSIQKWGREVEWSGSVADLRGYMSGLGTRSGDVLILYVLAHGVSDFVPSRAKVPERAPYLLCGDYSSNSPGRRYNPCELLRDAVSSKAALKLVVIDACRIGSDPRMGMFVNEFPALIENELKQIADSSLWVLLPNSLLQTSGTDHGRRTSVFGGLFADALGGAADDDDDGEITLSEIYGYISRHSQDAQTPLLLRGGHGHVGLESVPDHLYVLRRGRHRRNDEPAEKGRPQSDSRDTGDGQGDSHAHSDAPEESSTNDQLAEGSNPSTEMIGRAPAAKASDQQQSEPESQQSETTVQAPVIARTDTALERDSQDPFKEELLRAWRLRDQLQGRGTGWSPVDFAPLLWRRINALLMAYEQRYLAGSLNEDNENDELQGLRLLVTGLTELQDAMSSRAPGSGRQLSEWGSRLVAAWERFTASDEFIDRRRAADEHEELALAFQNFTDLTFLAPYYVAWHDAMSLVSDGKVPAYDDLGRLLDRLAEFDELSRRMPGPAPSQSNIESLLALDRELDAIHDQLENLLRLEVETAMAGMAGSIRDRQLTNCLATPLLPAQDRDTLISELLKPASDPRKLGDKRVPRPPVVRSTRWRRVQERATLQQKIVKLVDEDRALAIEEALSDVETMLNESHPDQELLDSFAAIGIATREFYDSIVGNVAGRQQAQTSDSRSALLLDARDFDALDGWPGAFVSFPRVARRSSGQLRIVGPVEPGKHLDIDVAKSPAPFRLALHEAGPESRWRQRTVRLRVDYDSRLFDVHMRNESTPDQRTILPGTHNLPATFDSTGVAHLDLLLAAKSEVQPHVATHGSELTVEATAGDQTASYSVHINVLGANDVDLAVQRVGSSEVQFENNVRIALEMFPNRVTSYRLKLANRSRKPRNVNVKLFAIPRPRDATWPPGRIPAEIVDNSTENLVALHLTHGALALPAGAEPVDIKFQRDQPPEGAADDGSTEAASKEPAADISGGLACVITDLATKDTWFKWIELSTMAPSRYVEMAQPRFENGRVALSLRALKDALPANLAEQPITIYWQIEGEFASETNRVFGEIDSPESVVQLFSDVKQEPGDGSRDFRIVRVSVDCYPRAFVWRVPIGGAVAPELLSGAVNQVRIVRVSDPGMAHVYYPPGGYAANAPNCSSSAAPNDKTQEIRLAPGEEAALRGNPSAKNAVALQVQVDTRFDVFESASGADVGALEVGFDLAQREGATFYSDRQMAASLAGCGEDGTIALRASVSDYDVVIDPQGTGKHRAQAELRSGERVVGEDHLDVVVDHVPPTIGQLYELGAPDEKRLKFALAASDLSGVSRLEFGVDKRGDGKLDDQDEIFNKDTSAVHPKDGQWELDLGIEALAPGNYALLARAVDRVGHASEYARLEFAKRPKPSPSDAPGVIRGIVRSGKILAGEGRMQVLIVPMNSTELPRLTASTGKDGRFEVRDVPRGIYKLVARGTVLGVRQTGELTGVEPWPATDGRMVHVLVDRADNR